MQDWNHVADENSVRILQGIVKDTDSLQIALDFACDCVANDETNQDVSYTTLNARIEALESAQDFLTQGDKFAFVNSLRLFWSI